MLVIHSVAAGTGGACGTSTCTFSSRVARMILTVRLRGAVIGGTATTVPANGSTAGLTGSGSAG